MKEMPSKDEVIKEWFDKNHVTLQDLADITYEQQKTHFKDLDKSIAAEAINKVMKKREVRNALITAIALDDLAQKKQLPEPLQSIVSEDRGTFGIDENMAIPVASLYGSIGISAFGYLDNFKTGVIKRLNDEQQKNGQITTFMDDQLSAIVAAAEGYIGHNQDLGHPNN